MSLDLTPTVLRAIALPQGRFEVVEWHWPDIIDFARQEREMMLEMSLPPHATDASAEFPELAPGDRCFVGTLFLRFPGVTIHGRGEGGHIRVLRCLFDESLAAEIAGHAGTPPLPTLQALLDIRNEALRKLMGMALRELEREDRSAKALAALQTLIAVELQRVLERQLQVARGGRLAAWQYRRIRERLAQGGDQPTATELAALCGISVRHLNRQFHLLTGSTVADYVTNFWVERAKAMLASDAMPIKAVAFASGFTHANSFARAFRRVTGVSPQLFRQRALGSRAGA